MKRFMFFSIALSLAACGEKPAPTKKDPASTVEAPKKADPQTAMENLRKLPNTEAKVTLSLNQWKQVNDPSQKETLHGIAFGNGVYVAIGEKETILTSADSIVWEQQTIEKLDSAQQIAFGAGTFILRSRDATYRSTDGKAWSVIKEAPLGSRLRFLNGQFTQVLFGNRFFTSPDGLVWKEHTFNGLPEALTAYGAGVFVVADFFQEEEDSPLRFSSFTSKDGEVWESSTSDVVSHVVTGLLYAKGLFLLVQGDGQLVVSSDGKAWSKGEKLVDKRVFGDPIYCGERFVVSASSATEGAAIFSSPDAKTWTKHTFEFAKGLNDLTCGDGVIVGVGIEGAIFIARH
jgi:hypothetical protein